MPIKHLVLPPERGEVEGVEALRTRVFKQVLYNRVLRGVDLKEVFVKGKGSDPFLMEGMDEAVSRIALALKRGERIVIHGDYDADGITGLALLFYALKWVGGRVVPFVPDRFTDGYGLSRRGVRFAKRIGASLLITVDCGVSSPSEVEEAKALGMDVIITDHHGLPERLPDTVIVHPRLGNYPYPHLTGVGVAFKLALALYERLGLSKRPLYHLLDFLSIGTVADVGYMLGENRLLVKHGLRLINMEGGRFMKPGIRAIVEEARISLPISTWNISMQIAPRINAAGRMGNVNLAMELLLKQNPKEAADLARRLAELNRKRQSVQNKALGKLLTRVDGSSPIAFVSAEDISEGIAGILANKLVEAFSKPAVVVALKGGVAKGSLRSFEPFNVYDALNSLSDLFSEGENYGGHALAGGFKISADKLAELKRRLEEYAFKVSVDGKFVKTVMADAELRLEEINHEFWRDKTLLKPYGHGFPDPVFVLHLKRRPQVYGRENGEAILEHLEGERYLRMRVKGVFESTSETLVVENLRLRGGVLEGDVLGFL